MATNTQHNGVHNSANQAATNGFSSGNTNSNGASSHDFESATRNMTHEEKATAAHAARFGYGPLAHIKTDTFDGAALQAFGGEFQPGLYKGVKDRKFANPAPLGLSAFALTTFVLSLINLGTRGLEQNNIIISLAFGYGGLVQLLAGMWEMAVGNTFGATALSSYGGFWISFAILLTPGGFEIEANIEAAGGPKALTDSVGFYLIGWFIFTTILLFCTLKSTVAFFFLFFTLDLAFLLLGVGYLNPNAEGAPNTGCIRAGGAFGMLAAFAAWYNALAGIADTSNSFFIIPVAHFPWSAKVREDRMATKSEHSA